MSLYPIYAIRKDFSYLYIKHIVILSDHYERSYNEVHTEREHVAMETRQLHRQTCNLDKI